MMTPQNIRTDDVINLRTINMRGNAIVRFVSAEPRDAGPHLPHWAPDVARVVLEGKNRPPLGYYELHAGASLVLDLQAFDKTEAVLKVLAGTVSVEAFGLGPLLTRKGETCIFYEKRTDPKTASAGLEKRWSGEYVDDAEPAPAPATADESDMVRCYRCQMRLPSRLTRDIVGPRGGIDRVCAACDHFDLEKRAEVIALRRARNAAPPNGVGTVPAGEPIRQEHLNTVDQAEPEKDLTEQLAAYVATVRSLSARLEQAEQTRDAAQAEASRQTDRARQAFEGLKMERQIVEHARAEAAGARMDADAWCREAERLRVEAERLTRERDAFKGDVGRLAALLESTRAAGEAWKNQAQSAEAARRQTAEDLEAERMRATGYLSLRDSAASQRDQLRAGLEVERLRSAELARTIDQLQATIGTLDTEINQLRRAPRA